MSSAPELIKVVQPIIQGRTETQYPSVCEVSLTSWKGMTYTCTGTLISPDLVLCAAHCVDAPKIHAAVCIFKGTERVSARRWFWNRTFDQDSIEVNRSEHARLVSVGKDYTILQLDTPIFDIQPSPMMEFKTFKRLYKKGDIHTLTAVGFGRFSKHESDNLVAGVEKRSASFNDFSLPNGTETFKVYPQEVVAGEPVSIAVGDSGGPYFARYNGVDYVVATVSTVTYDENGHAAWATALSVDAPIRFFGNTVFQNYEQTIGPVGYKYHSPRKISADRRNIADLVINDNMCIDEYCMQEKPVLFGALALAPVVMYALLLFRLKDIK